MKIDMLLDALRKVRVTGSGEWVACCPAHDDKTPSLAIKEVGDGRILVHCYANCPVEEVLGSIGMTLSDLMPDRAIDHRIKRIPFNARTVLEANAFSSLIVAIAASDMAQGKTLTAEEKTTLWQISGELTEAVSYVTR
jgi:hypothetical protein